MPLESPTNVVLLAVDTLRADHLACYGYHRPTSPTINELARSGVLAENFFCAGLPTHPSFTTLFTGQHPITHGIVAHGPRNSLSREAPYLSQLLLGNGFTTCAVDNLAQMRPWFRRGFEFYIDPSLRHLLFLDVGCEELNARAIQWLRDTSDEPFFLFIHYWDPHWPLNPPARYQGLWYTGQPVDPNNHTLDSWWDEPLGGIARDTWLRRPEGLITDPDYVVAMYDQEIRHLDDGIADLLGEIRRLGLEDETLVMLLGDHGESFTEHGIFFDHHGLYDNVLHVPLIARWPGHLPAGRRVSPMLQHHDVAPTLLEAVGIDPPTEMDGISAWPLLTGETNSGGREQIVSCECTWQAKWSLRTDRHKFILARKPDPHGGPDRELYDLQADPHELTNLVAAQPELAATLEANLEGRISERLADLGKDEDPLREQDVSLTLG